MLRLSFNDGWKIEIDIELKETKEWEEGIWWSTIDNAHKIMASLFIFQNFYGLCLENNWFGGCLINMQIYVFLNEQWLKCGTSRHKNVIIRCKNVIKVLQSRQDSPKSEYKKVWLLTPFIIYHPNCINAS